MTLTTERVCGLKAEIEQQIAETNPCTYNVYLKYIKKSIVSFAFDPIRVNATFLYVQSHSDRQTGGFSSSSRSSSKIITTRRPRRHYFFIADCASPWKTAREDSCLLRSWNENRADRGRKMHVTGFIYLFFFIDMLVYIFVSIYLHSM